MLAAYAVPRGETRGRVHAEAPDPLRDPFVVDRRRIVECTAFRRLEQKTQVFAPAFHDHFRTRLTHTLEAAQIARCLSVALQANEDLAEAITLAHDLGHPPFGHAGEAALDALMAGHGGFNHNAHSFRVVEELEHPFPAFRGLNLTLETLAGLRAHATRYDRPATTEAAPIEADLASVADRIAYNTHDLEDAVGAELVGEDELSSLELWRRARECAIPSGRGLPLHAIRRPVLDALTDLVLEDVIDASEARLGKSVPPRPSAGPLVAPSADMERALGDWERFLAQRVYLHPAVQRTDAEGRTMIGALFDGYRQSPELLPARFGSRVEGQGLARVICDYIAGMTDRFCRAEYGRVTGASGPGRLDDDGQR